MGLGFLAPIGIREGAKKFDVFRTCSYPQAPGTIWGFLGEGLRFGG